MYFYQYFILTAFCSLYFNSETKSAAKAFLFGWLVYLAFTINLSVEYYYAATATIELAIGYSLNKRYRLVSYLSYMLIIVNAHGLYLYKTGVRPEFYDINYAVISVAQVLLLIARLNYGRYELPIQYLMDALVDFDSRKARDTM